MAANTLRSAQRTSLLTDLGYPMRHNSCELNMNMYPSLTPKGLLSYVRPYRWRLAAGVAAVCGTNIMRLISPIILGRAIDALRTEVTHERLLNYAAVLVLMSLLQGIIVFSQRRAIAVTSFRI